MTDSANTPIISHDFNRTAIQQRAEDGYLNATAMCKAAGKRFNDYSVLSTTQDFLAALASDTGILVSQLVVSKRGNSKAFTQGTWIHPHVAIHLAQWLSPEFAVQVTKWVFEWMSGGVDAPVPATTVVSDAQARGIQQAVAMRCAELDWAHFASIYSGLKSQFLVPKYDRIPAALYEDALTFIRSFTPAPRIALQTELALPREVTPAVRSEVTTTDLALRVHGLSAALRDYVDDRYDSDAHNGLRGLADSLEETADRLSLKVCASNPT